MQSSVDRTEFAPGQRALRYDSLDLMRGVAALLVVAGHLRGYVFESYGSLPAQDALSLATKGFYFVTGLGHQAVLVFFALSGFLVGGKALDDLLGNCFSWPRYLLRRLTRLWIVIVPALALTLVLDTIGIGLTGGRGYDGSYYQLLASGLSTGGTDHSLTTLLGNLAFLQTIVTPTFGSNGPMWSLANEFWYYIIFPLAAWLYLASASLAARAVGLGLLAALAALLPGSLLAGGAIWIAGAAAAWCSRQAVAMPVFSSVAVQALALAALLGALVLSKARPEFFGQLPLGLTVAATLPVIAHLPRLRGALLLAARGSSEISYTLYLTHFPLLTLIALGWILPDRLPPRLAGAAIYTALLAISILSAAALWWCFERNTDRIFRRLSALLTARREAH